MGGRRALPAPSHEYYATGGGGGSSYSSGDNTTYETGANAGNGRIIIYQVVAGSGGGGGGMTGSGAVNTIAMFTGETVLGASKLTQHSGYMTVDGDLVIRADRGLYLGNNEDGGGLYFSGVGRMYAQQSDKKLYYSTFGGDIFDLTGGGGLPSGAVMFFNLASCPSGWSELMSAQGRYVVGKPASGTLGGTAGTPLSNLENRAVGKHTHSVTDTGHSHMSQSDASNSAVPGPTWSTGYPAHQNEDTLTSVDVTGIAVNSAGTVDGTNAPYLQLLTCQKI